MADPVTYWESYDAPHRGRLVSLAPWGEVGTVIEVGACCSPNARLLLTLFPELRFHLVDRDEAAMRYGQERLGAACLGIHVRDVTEPGWWKGLPDADVVISCWLLSELDPADVPTAAEGIIALGRFRAIIEPARALNAAGWEIGDA